MTEPKLQPAEAGRADSAAEASQPRVPRSPPRNRPQNGARKLGAEAGDGGDSGAGAKARRRDRQGRERRGRKAADEEDARPLLAPGQPAALGPRRRHRARLASLVALLLMAHDGPAPLGRAARRALRRRRAWGVMDLLGTFDDADDRVVASTTLGELAPSARAARSRRSLLFGGSLSAAQSGRRLPQWVWGILVTRRSSPGRAALFELGVALGPWATDELGARRARSGSATASGSSSSPARSSTSRAWAATRSGIRGRPTTARSSREILARDDWISLWWAQDGWFWSKPVLDMWIQAIAMATLGVHYQPDKMLHRRRHASR